MRDDDNKRSAEGSGTAAGFTSQAPDSSSAPFPVSQIKVPGGVPGEVADIGPVSVLNGA